LNFDGGQAEYALFSGVMPQNYDNSGVIVRIHWACEGNVGDVDWFVRVERVSDSHQDIDGDGFQTNNTILGEAVPATAGHVKTSDVSFTDGADMDNVDSGDGFRLRITRDGASDTNTDDINLVWLEMLEVE
jgi:hypothetical protein